MVEAKMETNATKPEEVKVPVTLVPDKYLLHDAIQEGASIETITQIISSHYDPAHCTKIFLMTYN